MIRRVRAALGIVAILVGSAFALLFAVFLVGGLFFLVISGGDTELVLNFLAGLARRWEGILLSFAALSGTAMLTAAGLSIWGRHDAEGRPRSWDLWIVGGVNSFVFFIAFYLLVMDRGGAWMQGKGLLGDFTSLLMSTAAYAGFLRRVVHRTIPEVSALPGPAAPAPVTAGASRKGPGRADTSSALVALSRVDPHNLPLCP